MKPEREKVVAGEKRVYFNFNCVLTGTGIRNTYRSVIA